MLLNLKYSYFLNLIFYIYLRFTLQERIHNKGMICKMIFGYARVSTVDQNLDRQIKELEQYGCERIEEGKPRGLKTRPPSHRRTPVGGGLPPITV
ncbi:recombinase family protein, partial [Pseudomonas sivasensis]|uniref:recombinase family protein n=1 Tax=Pseudomonas sivasensis TaxID=1880678 RepID=UPI003D04928C